MVWGRKYAVVDSFFFLIPPIFYLFTCAPTIGLGDTALLLDGIQNLKINTHVNNHNITVIFGWLFSFLPHESIAYKGNLVSVFFGSLTVSLFYYFIYDLFRSRITAAVSAGILMISHSMWWHSTIVECYAPNALFMVAFLLLLLRYHGTEDTRYLYGLFLIAGLSIFNHVQMGILSIGATIVLVWRMAALYQGGKRREVLWLFGLCSVFFLIGFLPYFLTFLKDVYYGGSFSQVFADASGGSFKSIMMKGGIMFGIKDFIFLVIKQFPSPFLALILPGIFLMFLRNGVVAHNVSIVAMFMVNTIFFMFFNTWDKFAFLLPSFVLLAFSGAHGIDFLVKLLHRKKSMLLTTISTAALIVSMAYPPFLYANISKWGSMSTAWYFRYNNNYTANSHNCAEYIANPDKRNYYEVERFAEALFAKLPSGAIFVDDDSRTYYPIRDYYMKYYGKRSDLKVYIINSWGFSNWGLSPERFANLIRESYRMGKEFYIVSMSHPFREILSAMPDKNNYIFDEFPLDDKRWVYRLRSANEVISLAASSIVPHIYQLKTGIGFNSKYPRETKLFRPSDRIMVSLEFEKNGEPFSLHYEWLSPDGKIFFKSKEFSVPADNTSVWSHLERTEGRVTGRWVVKALSGSLVLHRAQFIVE